MRNSMANDWLFGDGRGLKKVVYKSLLNVLVKHQMLSGVGAKTSMQTFAGKP